MNKKDLRVKKLLERGVTNPGIIARKLGYSNLIEGMQRVKEAIKRLKK